MSAVAAASPQADVSTSEAYAARLYERYNRAIFGLCLKELRSREDADDAMQTTFIYALLSLRRGVVPQLELPWLFTIARNTCSTRRRSGSRRGANESPHDLDSLQDRLAGPDRSDVATSEDFLCALRAIPESQRKALLLREWRGLSYEEIGAELGLSQSATEALLFRARHNVAEHLGKTVGTKALNGLPLLSLLRNLFQATAAKTLAVGAAAALTIVAVPSAHRQVRPAAAAPAAVPHVGLRVQNSQPVRDTQTPSKHSATRQVKPVAAHEARVEPARRDVALPPATVRPPVAQAPDSPRPAASDAAAPSTAIEQAGDLVETASGVAGGVELPTVALPTVSLPPVITPAITVQPPTLPSPDLP